MCCFQPKIRNLNAIGTDQDMTIYRGFATQIPDLKLILCAYHQKKNDAQKTLHAYSAWYPNFL